MRKQNVLPEVHFTFPVRPYPWLLCPFLSVHFGFLSSTLWAPPPFVACACLLPLLQRWREVGLSPFLARSSPSALPIWGLLMPREEELLPTYPKNGLTPSLD